MTGVPDPPRATPADIVAAIVATFPVLTPQQCDRVAVLLWPHGPVAEHGTAPPHIA